MQAASDRLSYLGIVTPWRMPEVLKALGGRSIRYPGRRFGGPAPVRGGVGDGMGARWLGGPTACEGGGVG